jgi:hypothetical protein
MKVLNIFKSNPGERYKKLVDEVTRGGEVKEIHLYEQEEVDYDQLVKDIFESDKVYTWW